MWEAMVALVRLPVTLLLLVLATGIALPFIIVFGIGAWILGYLAIPFVLVSNDKSEFKKYLSGLEEPLTEIQQTIASMYKGIFEWGFPSS